MPLSREEQVVITHKFFIHLNKLIAKPIDLHDNVRRYIGHSELVLSDTKTLCTQLAEQTFRRTSGVRSLKFAVEDIGDEFVKAYRSMDGPVDESINRESLLKFDVVQRTTPLGRTKFAVVKQLEPLPEVEEELEIEIEIEIESDSDLQPVERIVSINSEEDYPPRTPSPTSSQSSTSAAGAPAKKK